MSTALQTSDTRVAPVDRDAQRPERKPRTTLLDYLRALCDKIEEVDKDAEDNRIEQIVTNRNYARGRQLGYFSRNEYSWKDDHFSRFEKSCVSNEVGYHVEMVVTELMRAETELNVEPASDDPTQEQIAEYADRLLAEARRRNLDSRFMYRESLNRVVAGTFFRETYISTKRGGYAKVPRTGKVSLPPQATAYECSVCEEPLTEPASECPLCGSEVKEVAAEPVEVEAVEGYDELPLGEVVSQPRDPIAVKVIPHTAATIPEALAVRHKFYVARAVVESEYPGIDIPSTGNKKRPLGYGEEDDTKAKSGPFEELECDHIWLDPVLYAQMPYQHDETLIAERKTPDGKVIVAVVLPAGKSLVSMFPNGLFICRIGKTILDLQDESKNGRWTGAPYRMRPEESVYGESLVEPLIPGQNQKNYLRQLELSNVVYNSVGYTLFRKEMIAGGQLPNDPGKALEVVNTGDERALSDVVYQVQAQPLGGDVYALDQQISGEQTNRAGTFNTDSSATDIKAMGTATGVAVLRERAVGRQGPGLAVASSADVEQGYQFLEAIQRAYTKEQYKPFNGKTGESACEAFRKCNVRQALRIEVVPGSYMPQTEAQKQANLDKYLAIVAAIAQAPIPEQRKQELVELAASLYKVPSEADPRSAIEHEAGLRLEEALELAGVAEGEAGEVADPETAAQLFELVLSQMDTAIDPDNDDHGTFINFYRQWLISDEARASSQFQREIVRQLIKAHEEAIVGQQTKEVAAQTAAQAPAQIGQMMAKEAEANQDMNIAAQQREQAMSEMQAQQPEGLPVV